MTRMIGLGLIITASGPNAGVASTDEQAEPARAQFRASTYSQSAQAEVAIDIGVGATGEEFMVAAWSSRRQREGLSAVCAQRFSSEGVAIGAETVVNESSLHAAAPDVAASLDGVTWLAWHAHVQDGHAGSIIARRYDAGFNPGPEIIVNQQQLGDQRDPVLAVSPDGTVAVIWTSTALGEKHSQVCARLMDHAGAFIGDEFAVSDAIESGRPQRSEDHASAAWLADGSLAVIMAVADEAHRPACIRFQRFDRCGARIDPEIVIGEGRSAPGIEPVIAATTFGSVVAWHEAQRDGANYDVIAQRLDHAGRALGEPIGVATEPGLENGAAVAAAHDGRFAIAWNSRSSDNHEGDEGHGGDDGGDIFIRTFTTEGAALGPATRFNTHHQGAQTLRQAAATKRLLFGRDDRLICGWNGDGGLGDATAAHVSVLSPKPLEAAGRAQGVTPDMPPALVSVGSSETAAQRAEPHVPPVFDASLIEKGEREVIHGLTDIGFTGILSTGWTPPDPSLAVGPNHLVLMTNGAIAFFTKEGTLLFQDLIEGADGFWGPLGATNFVFDPETLYDELSGRFFAMASEDTPGTQSFVLVAVSDDSNPQGTWHKYRFNTTALAGSNFDSPNIAVDADVVYITGDGNSSANNYSVFTFDKPSLLAGAPPAITRTALMTTSTQSAAMPPVSFDDPPALYLIEHKESAPINSVRLIALTDPLGVPTFTSFTLTVPTYSAPEDPPQMGTTIRPETFDARFWSAAYRNGSLWATHHVGSTRVLARWYQIDMNGWPTSGTNPALVQSGTIDPGPTVRTFFTAITVDDKENAALVFARSSPTEFISMATAYRQASDPLGFFAPPVTRQSSTGAYTTSRWGDYAGINIDPADQATVWAHHEYAVSNSWRTWVAGFPPAFPPPANDLCANAINVGTGATAISTLGAFTDGPDEPAGCGFGASTQISSDVWFKHLATCTGPITVSVCDADFDSRLAIYNSCPGGPGQALACDDNGCGQASTVTFAAVANSVYRIRVGGTGTAEGSGTLTIACDPPPPTCLGDVVPPPRGDGTVDIDDLFGLIGAWGSANEQFDIAPPETGGDGTVDIDDLFLLLGQWGPCP